MIESFWIKVQSVQILTFLVVLNSATWIYWIIEKFMKHSNFKNEFTDKIKSTSVNFIQHYSIFCCHPQNSTIQRLLFGKNGTQCTSTYPKK